LEVFGKELSRVSTEFKRSFSEARRFLSEGKYFIGWLILTCLILYGFYKVPQDLQTRLRWAGTFFEFLGVSAVVIGISHRRVSFGRPSILAWPRMWISSARYIIFRRKTGALSASSQITGAATLGEAGLIVRRPETLDERVASLEQESKAVRQEMTKLQAHMNAKTESLHNELCNERAQRERDSQSVNERLEQGMVGDSHLEIAGVAFLLLGLFFGNLAQDLAVLLSHFGLR
jgi:hypothetical protein